MKLKFYAFLLLACIYSCKTIPKVVLPYTGEPPRVTYTRTIPVKSSKEVNYDILMKAIFELSPKSRIINEDKPAGNLQIVGYGTYILGKGPRQFSYSIDCSITNEKCVLTLNDVHILHYDLERFYFDDRRKTTKKFNPVYTDLDKNINAIIDELAKRVN